MRYLSLKLAFLWWLCSSIFTTHSVDLGRTDLAARDRRLSAKRIIALATFFGIGFIAISAKVSSISLSAANEPRVSVSGNSISSTRAAITDRHGRILATNVEGQVLYAHPQQMIEPIRTAELLSQIFPDLDRDRLVADFTGNRKFLWIRRIISPGEAQEVLDIGDPGLLFGQRSFRLYPNGALAAHILGGSQYGREGVNAAEIIGVAGVERFFDEDLRDPNRSTLPIVLSLDLGVQALVEEILESAMAVTKSKAAAAVIMQAHTGEVISLASLPDFDPNNRPVPPNIGDPSDSPLFNRAVQGVYEQGSALTIFALAQATDIGLIDSETEIDVTEPLRIGRFEITDKMRTENRINPTEVLVQSSNVGSARLALRIGPNSQRDFLSELGFLDTSPLELAEAASGRPLAPLRWSELTTMTVSYGYGLSVSPLHLAVGYAALANGGLRVSPSILKERASPPGQRIISAEAASAAREMLRVAVADGPARLGDVEGYSTAGMIGTTEKPRSAGGYDPEKTIAIFAAMFPGHAPKYVLVILLDEPSIKVGSIVKRSAQVTAAPVGAEIIRRIIPHLDMRPQIESSATFGIP